MVVDEDTRGVEDHNSKDDQWERGNPPPPRPHCSKLHMAGSPSKVDTTHNITTINITSHTTIPRLVLRPMVDPHTALRTM